MFAPMDNKHDIIIIGAGISGLALAFYCARAGLSVLVIEKGEQAGGILHTRHFRDGTRDFWLELGAHTCYNSYQHLLEIVEQCGLADRMLPRAKVPFKVYANGQLKSISSCLNYMELLLAAPRLLFADKEGLSITAYYAKAVGKRNYQRLFRHVFNGVISQEAGDFPAELLFKKRTRRKNVLKSFTFQNGLQSIADAIAGYQSIEVLTGKEICKIDHEDDRYFLTATDGSSFETGVLALATGVQTATPLLKGPFPEIAQELKQIRTAKVESVGVVIDKDKVAVPPAAGIIATDDQFYSVVCRDTVPDDAFRGFTFHFKPNLLDHEAKLKRIGEVLQADPALFADVAACESTVPALRIWHGNVIAAIDRLIARKRLLLTGNYFSGLAIEDCILRSLHEFYRLKMLRSGIHFHDEQAPQGNKAHA